MKAKEAIAKFEAAQFKGRHGDVVVIRDDTAPKDGPVEKRRAVALGEVTGHDHVIARTKKKQSAHVRRVVEDLTQCVVEAADEVDISHQEHTTQLLPVGTYRTGIQKQYSPDGSWSPVAD